MRSSFWKFFTLTLLSIFLFIYTTISIYTEEYLDDSNYPIYLKINDKLTQIELDFFANTLLDQEEFLDILSYLTKIVSPTDTDKTTPHHFLYARTLYLSALILPDTTSLTDIFEAVLIEEALIPFINTLNYNTSLSIEEKLLWKNLAITFYTTQAHYNFLGQNKPSQAVLPLQIALSLNPNSFFLLYELAILQKYLPQSPLTINPTKEIENFLQHPLTTASERALIYLMLSTLVPDNYTDYITYAHTAWLAAVTLGETQESMLHYINQHLPKPLHPEIDKLFVQKPL